MYILFLFIFFVCLIFCWGPHLYYLWISSKSLVKKSIYLFTAQKCYYKLKYSQLPTPYNTLEDGEGVLTLITTFLPSYPLTYQYSRNSLAIVQFVSENVLHMCFVYKMQISSDWQNNVWFKKISISVPTPQDFPFQCVFEDPPAPRNFQNFWTGTSYHPQKFKVVLVLQK